MDPDPDFSGSDPDFLADPDLDSEKKSDPDPRKKPGSETLFQSLLSDLFNLYYVRSHNYRTNPHLGALSPLNFQARLSIYNRESVQIFSSYFPFDI